MFRLQFFTVLVFCFFYGFPCEGHDIEKCTYSEFVSCKTGKDKAHLGVCLSRVYLLGDLDSILIVGVELYEDAHLSNDKFVEAIANKLLGSYFIRKGELSEGIGHLEEAKEFFESREDAQLTSELWNEIGNAYYLKADYKAALYSYRKSLNFGQYSADPTDAFNAEIGMGKAYLGLKDTLKGKELLRSFKNKALKLGKYASASDALAFMGQIELDQEHRGLAIQYYENSIRFAKKSNSEIHIAHGLNNLAIVYFMDGALQLSLQNFEEALKIRKTFGNEKGVIESYYNLGSFYMETNKDVEAVEYFKMSSAMANKNEFYQDEKDALVELQSIYTKQKDIVNFANVQSRIGEIDELLSKENVKSKDLLIAFQKTLDKTKDSNEKGWLSFDWKLTILLLLVVVVFTVYLLRLRFS